MARPFSIAAFAFLAMPASLALAAADEVVGALPTVKQGLATGITGIVVFLLVLAVLGAKVWPTITKALDQRAAKIKEEIEAAELAQQQAKEALQQYEKSLAQARAEAQKMLDDAKLQQQAIAADLKAKADVELGAMRERAKRDIDAAKRAALAEIYSEASNLATSIASKILQKEIRPQDQQRLVDESLAEFQTVHAN
jgi:F-type H+-transporting ATPase subunit b